MGVAVVVCSALLGVWLIGRRRGVSVLGSVSVIDLKYFSNLNCRLITQPRDRFGSYLSLFKKIVFVPTFITKVTEYLCSSGFFFRQICDRIFKYHSKGIVFLSLNLKRYFTCDHFSSSYGGL